MESRVYEEATDERRVIPFGERNGVQQAPIHEATGALRQDVQEKALPLPSWLVKVYFIFPIILYIPDAIFNYYVYSDGAYIPNAPLAVQISQVALWGFLSIGVVGMAYLLSVLAPWHWTNGHRLQALFCWVGVLIATGVTIWNSLSYRSVTFSQFKTDQWVYDTFPQLAARGISITMILVAIAPPFWGLFWALVQPTSHRKSLSALAENHAEKLMRVQHEAELKRLRAEANAKVREAQLKGMAQTAAAARAQAGTLFSRKDGDKATTGEQPAVSATTSATPEVGGEAESATVTRDARAPLESASSQAPTRRRKSNATAPAVERAEPTGLGRVIPPTAFGAPGPNTVENPVGARQRPTEGVIQPGQGQS
jgi:hypothetical protein